MKRLFDANLQQLRRKNAGQSEELIKELCLQSLRNFTPSLRVLIDNEIARIKSLEEQRAGNTSQSTNDANT